jgi:hypothetical protein
MTYLNQIYVDGTFPASIVEPGITTECQTLADAITEWQRLTPYQQKRAWIVCNGRTYVYGEIDRLHFGSKAA